PDLVIRDAREYIGRPLPPQSNPPFWFDLPRETGNNIRRLSVSITSGGLLSSETLLYRENFGRTNSNRFLYDHFRTNSVPSLSRPRPSGSVPWYLNR
ncbi:MAG: hypothetical protein K2Z81_01555, partial [Cyanobacteria bacterium]|nr:hypothetical protein [Cyanobacteriota bacterium]